MRLEMVSPSPAWGGQTLPKYVLLRIEAHKVEE
jgi:hypothetical protein